MKLSTRVRYGSRAMLDLALHGEEEPVSLEVLAREQHIPERYLAKIIQDLRRSGLIRSVRGAHGGYRLARPPAKVNLLEVWEALEGRFLPVDCLEAPEDCLMADGCVTREVWEECRGALVNVLASKNLARLARRHRRKQAQAAAERRKTGRVAR